MVGAKVSLVSWVLLSVIVVLGFWFRLSGIVDNHSFWADEAYTANFARELATGTRSFQDITKIPGISYQPLNIIILSGLIRVFGQTEMAPRLFSVVVGSLGIVFAFLIIRFISNPFAGLVGALLYALSQLNIANSTQAKPYVFLETILLAIIFVLVKLNRSKIEVKEKLVCHGIILTLLTIATFVHLSGVLFWVIYLVFVVNRYRHKYNILLKRPLLLCLLVTALTVFLIYFKVGAEILNLFKTYDGRLFFYYDHSIYLKNLLLKQYGPFLIFCFASFCLLWKKHQGLVAGLVVYLLALLFMWNYRTYTHNLRYLVPFFGVIFVFWGAFWGIAGEKFFKTKSWLPALIALGFLIVSQYKIVRQPAAYYSPNADFYGDVQMADYKSTFAFVRAKTSQDKNLAVFNDVPDAQLWYLPEKPATALFTKIDGERSSLEQFLAEKAKYQKGLLVVEDWESFLPEDIKNYAKKNMKLEYRVNSLPNAPASDSWPLEVYSWGI